MWKIIINDNEYQLSMPITFSEVYSNELDSAKVEISHITERIELAPCMPIILTNNNDLLNDWSNNLFTRVMLIDNFKEIQINIFEEIYNYELELCSLTKMLELYTGDTTISITQSRDNSVTLYTLKDALEKVLKTLRPSCKGKLICIFGCGGNRDAIKRPIMGKIASELADFVYVTSDNPRYEEPDFIARQVISDIKGCNYKIIHDRKQAVIDAFNDCAYGDMLVLCGKGAEDYIEIKGVKHAYSDMQTLTDLGFERI